MDVIKWNTKALRKAVSNKMRKIPRDEQHPLLEIVDLIDAAEEFGDTEVFLTRSESDLVK